MQNDFASIILPILRALPRTKAKIGAMSDAYHQLLEATIRHLSELKARGVRFVPVSPETLAGLRTTGPQTTRLRTTGRLTTGLQTTGPLTTRPATARPQTSESGSPPAAPIPSLAKPE